ncbi:MAG: type II toxin-antitoxin system HicA family toxin [Candidatus Bipolaricaulis sp.]|nr:type II toxin-antitoxin system HicA family toxin [Candidatus Bipolaricaulis sp.]
MNRLRGLQGVEVRRALERTGFGLARQRGSHVRMKHADGRAVTIPCHSGQVLGRGLIRKILRDAELTEDEFLELI